MEYMLNAVFHLILAAIVIVGIFKLLKWLIGGPVVKDIVQIGILVAIVAGCIYLAFFIDNELVRNIARFLIGICVLSALCRH